MHCEQSPPNVGAEILNQKGRREGVGRTGVRGGAWKAGAGTRWVHLRIQSFVPYAEDPEMQRKGEAFREGRAQKQLIISAPKGSTFRSFWK